MCVGGWGEVCGCVELYKDVCVGLGHVWMCGAVRRCVWGGWGRGVLYKGVWMWGAVRRCVWEIVCIRLRVGGG